MLSIQEAEKLIQKIPRGISPESHRAACSIVTGVKDGKSLKEIITYYWLSNELAQEWWDFFNFSEVRPLEKKKRGAKTSKLDGFIKSNIGKTVTPKQVSEEVGISLPTFYNFYNANRGFFKKVKRGEFEIINPDVIRNTGE